MPGAAAANDMLMAHTTAGGGKRLRHRGSSLAGACGLAAMLIAPTPLTAHATTDAELFRCELAAAPLGEICHLGSRASNPDDSRPETPLQAESRTVSDPTSSIDVPPTDALLRRFLEHELAKAERDDARSPFVHDENAPASFSRLIDDPSRANAAAFLADQMDLNLRHVKAQEAIRSVVLDLRAGRVDDELVRGLVDQADTIRAHAVLPRAPDTVLHELSMDRLRHQLQGAIDAPERPITAPSRHDRPRGRGLELRYYFSPSCPHCAEVTPAIETIERRYGSALAVIGIPIQLEGETITEPSLRAYRRRFELSFPFEQRPAEVARAVRDDDLRGVPSLVVLVHDVPGEVAHVPLTNARTTADIERALVEILDVTRPVASETGAEPTTPVEAP